MLKRFKVVLPFVLMVLCAMNSLNSCQPAEGHQKVSYLDAQAPVANRVEDLLSKMTLEEKVGQMSQYVGLFHLQKSADLNTPIDLMADDANAFYPGLSGKDLYDLIKTGRIGSFLHVLTAKEANELQKAAQQTRLKIPLLIGIDAIHGNALYEGATVYPTPLSLASTWDTLLVKTIAQQTAREMRATGSHWAFSPNVDVARDPRWGRVGETFGEDPFLVGEMGVAMVGGLQGDRFENPDNVLACIKHFVAGSEPVNGLNASPMDVSERTLREVYFPPYQKAIDAGAFTAMAAHNEINGDPCHGSKYLLTDILRNEMGFEGFVVSDWMDIERLKTVHRVVDSQKEACYLTVDAGMDMHMHGPDFLEPVMELVQEGRLSEERINQSVRKLLEAKFRLGLFENPFVQEDQIATSIRTEAHRSTALEAARKSIVLLKNDNLLPVKGDVKNILITGPNANNHTLMGDWSFEQPEENITTVVEGFEQVKPAKVKLNYHDMGMQVTEITSQHISEAVAKSKDNDLIVVVVGSNSLRYQSKFKTNGENIARDNLDLVGRQQELVEALHATGKPVVVVLINGRPLGVEWIAENIPAVVEAWEPGSEGGQAIAEVIFGKVNPSGKLPITIPRNVGQIPSYYNHKRAHYVKKYKWSKTGPLYAFGHGLSYSQFQYGEPVLSDSIIKSADTVQVTVEVTNSSKLAGEEVVQLYVRDLYSSVTRPMKELKGFARISLLPGETKNVTFRLDAEAFSFYNLNMEQTIESGEFWISTGSSSANEDLKTTKLTIQ
ncbi:glycoside hydrolase family 3 N-terminal domain-containing protein [Marinoscillum pacificum]|uniref:glycoside hydrolase family 3 N-terminal domain-containing protein n=1 Tax=Marinoscillum pacificum TaxID=392723 RepID=UPI0021571FF8|nr:glycoside hydrolase family 3 N-terminal domain-containing protein [Marinoscillum pacificum]